MQGSNSLMRTWQGIFNIDFLKLNSCMVVIYGKTKLTAENLETKQSMGLLSEGCYVVIFLARKGGVVLL